MSLRITMLPRALLAVGAIALAGGTVSAAAQCTTQTSADTALPDTPAGRALRDVLTRYNAGALTSGYWQRYVQSYGRLKLCSVRRVDSGSVSVWTRGVLTGSFLGLGVRMKADSAAVVDGFSTIQGIYPRLRTPASHLSDAAALREVRRYFAALDSAGLFSGAVLIARHDSVVFRQAYGQASIRYGVPNAPDTRFNIGSVTKVLTAVAIAQLVQAGTIAYADSVGKLLPDYPNAGVRRVTVHQLLTHTSGMARTAFSDTGVMSKTIRTVAGWLPLTVADPEFAAGTDVRYNNEAWIVLAAIIERVTGDTWYDYVQKNIYDPARMTRSGAFELDQEVEGIATDYTRYVWQTNGDVEWDPGPLRMSIVRRGMKGSPAGGTYSTVDDLLKLSITLRTHRLLSAAHVDRMLTMQSKTASAVEFDQDEGYGYGTEIRRIAGVTQVGKDGSIQGSSARWLMFPDLGYTLIVLSNRDFAAHRAGDYVAELVGRTALRTVTSSSADNGASTFSPRAAERYFARLAVFGGSGAVVVSRAGRVLYSRGFGLANRTASAPMTARTSADIASMSKDVTTVAVLQLVEKGMLQLEDSLAKFFPTVPAAKRDITIRQLLTHRSGLPQYFIEGDDFQRVTRQQALDSIFVKPLEFVPGTGEAYSDAGFVLLAAILEQRTGESIETLLARDQFRRAGLRSTYSYATDALRRAPDVAHGYLGNRDAGSAASYVSDDAYWVVKGAGGIVSSAEDLARWERALQTGVLLGVRGRELLFGRGTAGDSLALAGAPELLPSGRRAWVRTGSQDFGFSGGVLRYADDSTIVALVLNRQPEGVDIAQIRTHLLMDLDAFVSGRSPTAPPNASRLRIGRERLVGTYTFRDGSTVRVAKNSGTLAMTPDGPLATELLTYAGDTAGRTDRLALGAVALDALSRLCHGDAAPLRAVSVRQSDRIETFLKTTSCRDSVSTARVLGSLPAWWRRSNPRAPVTLLEATTAAGTKRFRFEWDAQRIMAVGGAGIAPPIIPLAATARRGALAAYHLGVGAAVRIIVDATGRTPARLHFPDAGGGWSSVATRQQR